MFSKQKKIDDVWSACRVLLNLAEDRIRELELSNSDLKKRVARLEKLVYIKDP